MKRHIVVPVMFRSFHDGKGWFGSELTVLSSNRSNIQNTAYRDGGCNALEALLDKGWSIISVQSTSQGASDSVPGAAVFVYVLESPERN